MFYVKQCNHYIVLVVGAKTFKTKVIENTIAPTWNAYFEVCHVYSFSSKWNERNGDKFISQYERTPEKYSKFKWAKKRF